MAWGPNASLLAKPLGCPALRPAEEEFVRGITTPYPHSKGVHIPICLL